MGEGGGEMITEQEAWDEYANLFDLQEERILYQSNGIEPSRIIERALVFDFIKRMKEAGFLYVENIQPKFKNWFFKCKGRTFSICVYRDGWMELRWG
jgi:hypothetical protein